MLMTAPEDMSSDEVRAKAQDLLRDIRALQTQLSNGGLDAQALRSELRTIYRTSPDYSLLIAAAIVASRWLQAREHLNAPPGFDHHPFPRQILSKRFGSTELDFRCLDVCEALSDNENASAEDIISSDLNADPKRGIDSLVIMMLFAGAISELVVQLSPKYQTRADLLQDEALDSEAHYLRTVLGD